ncbi:CLUMA_CG009273, isoform A [Clunio marinus]|uniref:CLUMA_CG009273, isoform A n=1 Tax=Clunio marinus TaxID=568069 RepID=A0A1J1I693_9DIPT|nr:CLUMA_CG009273, isoform A [Clunio marinus]
MTSKFLLLLTLNVYYNFMEIQASFTGCDLIKVISLTGQSIVVNYPGTAKAGSNCRYIVKSPVNTAVEASCTFNTAGSQPYCTLQRFLISRSGDLETRDASYVCGKGSTIQKSIGNEIVVAFTSNVLGSGSFQCKFKSITPSDSNCDCGWNVQSRIVGGSYASANEFVSHAGLVYSKTGEVFCGAIIVTQNWALTAAHCFAAYPTASTIGLLVGDHDLKSGSDTIWAALYQLQSYKKHEKYNIETNANDIALARTKTYIKFNRGVGPACMPYTFMHNDIYFDGKSLSAVGWGVTEYAGPSSNILKKAQIQVVNLQTCLQQNKFIDNTKICTKESQSGSSCSRDSGGGLYWSYGKKYAVGIISYGTYCASSVPSVNTRITSYINWIETDPYANCDWTVEFIATGQTYYESNSQNDGSCRFKLISPVNTFIEGSCTVYLDPYYSCSTRRFLSSRSGYNDMRDGYQFCYSGKYNLKSIGNELVISIEKGFASAGSFNCEFTAVAPTNDNCDCGWNVHSKIVNGEATQVNEFVSHVGLVDAATSDIFCGGIIINQQWIATASHCFDAFPDYTKTVALVGDHDITMGSDTTNTALYKLKGFVKHPEYDQDKKSNDIALAEIDGYIKYNPGVGPACLPYLYKNFIFDGVVLTAVGWGTTSFGGPSSDILQKVDLPVMNNEKCATALKDVDVIIDDTKICTDGQGERDTCGKDSGGGMYFFSNRYYAISLVSFGVYCASSYPSVNTRLDKYLGFIETYSKGFICQKY